MTQMEMYHIGLALNGIQEQIMMDFVIMQKGERMSDLISRQAAIDVIIADKIEGKALNIIIALGDGKQAETLNEACDRHAQLLNDLSSAQPEIIRCRNCKYQNKGSNEKESWNLCGYRPWMYVPTHDDHYCGYAERRTDE